MHKHRQTHRKILLVIVALIGGFVLGLTFTPAPVIVPGEPIVIRIPAKPTPAPKRARATLAQVMKDWGITGQPDCRVID